MKLKTEARERRKWCVRVCVCVEEEGGNFFVIVEKFDRNRNNFSNLLKCLKYQMFVV